MDEAARLEARLLQINLESFANWASTIDPLDGIGSKTAQFLKRGDQASTGRPLSSERIEQAVMAVRQGANDLTGRILRYAAFGSCTRFAGGNFCLIGDAPTLERLLAAATAEIGHDTRRFRKIYGGLLHSYFCAERQAPWFAAESIVSGHERLRCFLDQHVEKAKAQTPRTRWADALAAQPALLSRQPGKDFANAWINGDTKSFETVAEQLGIGGGSWLTSEVVRAALLTTANKSDSEFRAQIPSFLRAAGDQRFQALRDEIYGALLTRYSTCSAATPHGPLRDAVIAAWRAPWLTKNQAAWGRVSDTTRKMVESWLKLELIQQFFDVLSDDSKQDRRRFEFWRTYHDQIDSVYFVLGSEADRRSDEDWNRLKVALEGRALTYVGSRTTHAFIMYIGDRAIVEFSQTGNAAYFYDKHDLEIESDRTSATTPWLKREPPGKRMLHMDRTTASWEDQFRAALDRSVGAVTRAPVDHGIEAQLSFSNLFKAAPVTAHSAGADDTAIAYAQANGLAIDDKRSRGGSLWIRTGDGDELLNERLARWGFRYSAGRGWWRAN